MTSMRTPCRNGRNSAFANAMVSKWLPVVSILILCLPVACSHLAAPDIPKDVQAEKIVTGIVQGDSALTSFTCMAKIVLAMPDQPQRFFRVAIAGRQPKWLRMDLLTPFGGSSTTIASDGSHLFADIHSSGEFYERPIGRGDLSRFTGIDITVGELLDFLMGRIPVDKKYIARMVQGATMDPVQVELVDRRAIPRQRITLDEKYRPIRAQWLDEHGTPLRTLMFSGSMTIDGFVLPETIQLTAASQMGITLTIQRYNPNPAVSVGIFTLDGGKRTNER